MSDRTLGYAVILFLVLFLLIPTIYLSNKIFSPVYHRTVVFEQVNTLSFLHLEDPVKVRGIDAGIVRSISWKDNKTFVVIETDEDLTIHEGYRIMAEDKGLMGDRYVSINPGDGTGRLIGKKELLKGMFLMGPTEAVAKIRNLRSSVDSVAAITTLLRSGSPSKKSLIVRYNEIMFSLDSIALSLTSILCKIDQAITKNADTLSAILERTTDLASRLSDKVPVAIADVETIIRKTNKVLSDADSLVVTSGVLTTRLGSVESIALFNDFKTLEHRLTSLREAVNELQKQGLKLPVRIR
jgi:ABC-type transporter Mla subunit MlaD